MIETYGGVRYGYISGPMRGLPDFNFPRFDSAAAYYETGDSCPHVAFSPAQHDRDVWPGIEDTDGFAAGNPDELIGFRPTGYSFPELLVWDVEALGKSQDIVLLPGWRDSTGAAIELAVAKAFGLNVLYADFGLQGDGPGERCIDISTHDPYPTDHERHVQLAAQNARAARDEHERAWSTEPVNATPQRPSESIRTFGTGANRNAADHKHDYEGFLSVPVIRRYGTYMHEHRHLANGDLRDSDNWQKGIPIDVYVKSLVRHLFDVWELHRQDPAGEEVAGVIVDFDGNLVSMEDALCGVLFNASGLLHETLKEAKRAH